MNKPLTPGIIENIIKHGSTQQIEELLKNKKITPNSIPEDCLPPLYYAIISGNVHNTKILLDHGADIDSATINGTPLQLSIECGFDEISDLLLERGADPDNSAWWSSLSPMLLAIKRQRLNVIKKIISRGINLKKPLDHLRHHSYLSYACDIDNINIEIIKTLIRAGISVFGNGQLYKSPLNCATEAENIEVVKVLLENGAREEEISEGFTGKGSLHCAFKNEELTQLILDYTKIANSEEGWHLPPLHYSTYFKPQKIWDILIRSGKCDIEKRDQDGWTPFYHACSFGNQGMCLKLLSIGANCKVPSFLGKLPISVIGNQKLKLQVEYEISKRDRKILMLLLLERNFCKDSLFSKDNLPLDMFNLILESSDLKYLLDKEKKLPLKKRKLEEWKEMNE